MGGTINNIPKNIRPYAINCLAISIPSVTPYDTLARSIEKWFKVYSLINFLDHVFPTAF